MFYCLSSLPGADCTNLSSPHGGDVSFSVSLYAYGEASINCSEDIDFCTGTESLFLILCNKDQILSLQAKRGEGSTMSVCLSVIFMFIFSTGSHRTALLEYLLLKCFLRVVVEGIESVSLFLLRVSQTIHQFKTGNL